MKYRPYTFAPAVTDYITDPTPTLPNAYTKTYSYDLAGNRTSFVVQQGQDTVQSVSYTYDSLNRLSTVSEDGATAAAYTYDANGNRASLTYANGTSETYAYNLANWVTNLTNTGPDGTISAPLPLPVRRFLCIPAFR